VKLARRKALGAAALAVLVAWVAAQAVVTRLLRRSLDSGMSALGEMTGVEAGIDRVSASLFRETLKARGLHLGSPEGFEEPTVLRVDRGRLRLGLGNLVRGAFWIGDFRLGNVRATVVRNARGQVNVLQMKKAMDAYGKAHPPAKKEPEEEPGELKLFIRRARIAGLVELTDFKSSVGKPVRATLRLSLDARDIATYRGWRSRRGTFSITGHDESNPRVCRVDVWGSVEPLADPDRPTFDVEGAIENIDTRGMVDISANAGVYSDSATIRFKLRCVDGAFDREVSLVTVQLENARLAGSLARTTGLRKPMPGLTVSMPIGGTVQSPQFEWMRALSETLFQSFGKGLNKLFDDSGLNKLQENADSKGLNKTFNDALRGVGGLFRPKQKE
jgi:hypothetical protein